MIPSAKTFSHEFIVNFYGYLWNFAMLHSILLPSEHTIVDATRNKWNLSLVLPNAWLDAVSLLFRRL